MSYARCMMKRTSSAKVLLLPMLAVCLTACSTLSENAKQWSETAKAEEAAKVVQSDVHTPDIPKHLVKCLDKKAAKADSADQAVANELLTADERKACAKAILAWYKEIQAANKKAKVASAVRK